jgi:hydroxypyruvate isomerase
VKLCANISWLFSEVDFADRFLAAHQAGFSGVEFHHPSGHDSATIIKLANKANVEVVLFNASFGDLAEGGPGLSGVPGRETEFRKAVEDAVFFGEGIGDNTFVQIGQSLVPPEFTREQCMDVYIANLDFAAQRLQEVGCTVLVEPFYTVQAPQILIQSAGAALDAIAQVSQENIGLQFDVFHEHVSGGDIYKFLQQQCASILHFQFSDAPGRHQPGTGSINFQKIFDLLREQSYKQWVSAEYVPTGSSNDSLGWMKLASDSQTS